MNNIREAARQDLAGRSTEELRELLPADRTGLVADVLRARADHATCGTLAGYCTTGEHAGLMPDELERRDEEQAEKALDAYIAGNPDA